VFRDINLQLEKGDKIAFVGSNGSGKTTLAKIIAKQLDLSGGTITYGYNTEISYYAQEVSDALNLSSEVIDIILESAPDLTAGRVRNLLGAFLFNDEEVFKKVGVLSGGEKSRVALAKILVERSNLIILDEPTNHLDYKSRKVLQKAIEEFPGTAIIVSHDIDFLKPITNKVLELKNTSAKLFYGGIEYYLFKRKEYADERADLSDNAEKKEPSKRDQKRLDAEKRQKKFSATKTLKREITELEKKIQEFETDKSSIESDLTSTEVYQNSEKAREKNKEYEKVKQNLDAAYTLWTEKTIKLEEIENQFED
jgi:ATP-binding cassette subfamily F protein 3